MSTQSGAYEDSWEDGLNPFDEDYVDLVRCMRNRGEHEEYTDLLDNVNTPRELLSAMESFEESSNEIPSQAATGVFAETGNRYDVHDPRLGYYDESCERRRRNDRILNRGILSIYSKRLQKQLVGRIVRNSGRAEIGTFKPSYDEVLLNAHLTEQSKRNYGFERPFPVSYQQMELCHKDAFETPIERERSLDQFFRAVERRVGILADQLCRAFENNTVNARRILHDSIEFRPGHRFREMVYKIRRALDSRGSYAIWFHETNKGTEDYPEDISRGYPPDYDFGVIPTRYRYCGKPAIEPIRIREGGGESQEPTIEFKTYKYYSEKKVYHNIEGRAYEEKKFEEPTQGHFHILHACRWYNNECRCLGRSFDVNPRKNKAIPIDPVDTEHIRNIMFYNTKWPRWPVHIKVADGPEFEYVYRTESVCKESIQPKRHSQQLEESNDQDESGPSGQQSSRLPTKRDNRCADVPHGRSSRNGNPVEKFVEQFKLRPTWPLEHILDTKDWLESEWGTYIASDKQIQRTFQILMKITMNMTYSDLKMLYQNEHTMPIWGAISSNDLLNTYYTIEESQQIVEELLDFQMHNDQLEYFDSIEDAKKRFITDLYEILEKKHQKTNTFQIVSPPSAGKNFFIETVLAFYWNTGVIQNFNRYNNFPLMEAVNRRVNYWDEPNFEPDATETLKKLFAGTALKATVKFQKEANVQKTPVIITANYDKFTKEVWDDRIIKYYWYPCPKLKEYNKRLHPFAWVYLVDKYVTDL
ncbi:nonstructural protein [Bombyx mori densovirus 5]|uniref:Nonstructural protein n=1 Tax=Bombyx mori densovirus 5 (isolate Shinshu) TaxID=648251 RepID=Q9JFY3_BMDNS|nr:nonstructural protein [Bombyx mori densovirus 5]BAA96073.1 nonstructural protein [Bombyx mori densovirus 5]